MESWWKAPVLALAALAGASFQSGKPAQPAVAPWNGTYEEALQHAYGRNVPVVLVAIAEEEGKPLDQDLETFRRELFTSPEFVRASALAVSVFGGNRMHDLVDAVDPGTKATKKVCSVYKTDGCTRHQKLFDAIFREHNVDGELRSPTVAVLGPDRKSVKVWMDGNVPPLDEIAQVCTETVAKFGEGLTEAQFVEVRALLESGAAQMQKAAWGPAYQAWSKVLTITKKTRQAEQAKTEQARALAELVKQRDEARAWIQAGKVVDGYKRLVELAPQLAGSGLETELAREIAALEKGKDTKDAIAGYKRELEAEKLWNEAQALASAKDTKKADLKLRALIRKYGDTPAGKRAREARPELAADEDAKKQGGGGI